ncbi:hypothetical protein ACFY5D_21065 [Paeniglutamicibacter sp. NPDC012692]|uniref:hypothetical protein n=1 Tax=Paeniglutamicibacter sp. NPDC012692 TaxID=3364388 RepID=UPI0036A73B18
MAESDPLGRNWKLWGGVLAFIAAVVVLGLIFVPRNVPAPEAAPATAPAASSPVESSQPTASPSQPLAGDCPALSTDTSFPNDAPATEWKRHPAGMLLPVSTEHGPAKQDGDFWRCFSHTPTGAVMAGIALSFDFSSGGSIDAAVDSPNRQNLFAEVSSIPASSDYPLVSGFRVMSSNKDSASIEYLAAEAGKHGAIRFSVLWDDKAGDWRLDLSAGMSEWKLVNDPSGFTDWK